MKSIIKCQDGLSLTTKGMKKIISKQLSITVELTNDKKEIEFYQYSYTGTSIQIPIDHWDKVKGMVDKLIAKAECIWKEDC